MVCRTWHSYATFDNRGGRNVLAVHAFDTFLREERVSVRARHPLAPYTTMKVGGPADFFVEPRDEDELAAVFKAAHECEVETRLLGSGANLLVRDEGVRGAVVRVTHFKRRD